jgi:UDP-N-acetylmuramoylalanine--D-glutamate ligase
MDGLLFDFDVPTLIVGLGSTGLSCARYLKHRECSFALADSRDESVLGIDFLKTLDAEFQPIAMIIGKFQLELFKPYAQIIVSPGVSIRHQLFMILQQQGILVIGDIELFAQVVDQPIIAITGSNGKSTVTTLVEKIAQECGVKAIAGGNLGIPALDLLATQSELYILELSSFQLETTKNLHSLSATVLNISEDHMDRYDNLEDYQTVKEKIYHQTDNAVVNIDENSHFDYQHGVNVLFFGEWDKNIDTQYQANDQSHYFLNKQNVLFKNDQAMISAHDIQLKGRFNYLNILAALALLEPLQLNMVKQLQAIRAYQGLAHRCEWVANIDGVDFYNDSKGTNSGATIAAINGFSMSQNRQLMLIVGGVGKGADFSLLGQIIAKKIGSTILLGIDSLLIKQQALQAGALNDSFYEVDTMSDAVIIAASLAKSGDLVLFSPACASFDQYQNYMERGDDFKKSVLALTSDAEGDC